MCVHKDPKSGETKGPGSPLAAKNRGAVYPVSSADRDDRLGGRPPDRAGIHDASGRPMTVGNKGKPVMAVFA